jgi:hypothetical protein
MAYSKAEFKCSGDKASPCFRPFWIGKLRTDWKAEESFSHFSLLRSVQTGCRDNPALYPVNTAGSFSGDKAAGVVKLNSHLHLVPGLRTRRSISQTPSYTSSSYAA